MNELEVTWQRALLIWWSLIWRIIVIFALGFAILNLIQFGLEAIGMGAELVSSIRPMASLFVIVLAGIWSIRSVLTKRYSEFRLVLESLAQSKESSAEDSQSVEKSE